eukprot:TRINITY_DN7791_c0_g1_i1.p1 TRINITY_DN7791_c0_g1~~TRINITY_DN7791_c0_g1_i1.p1  ORF type:complete len:197 (-),score=30.85 TRINITY_DN7791_c0_g1_i1:334-924(-)
MEECFCTLSSISTADGVVGKLIEKVVLEIAVKTMRNYSQHPDVLQEVCVVITNICIDDSKATKKIIEEESFEKLVLEYLSNTSDVEFSAECCRFLADVVYINGHEQSEDPFKALEILIRALQSNSDFDFFVGHGSCAIGELCHLSDENSAEAMRLNLVNILVDILKNRSVKEKAQAMVISALNSCTTILKMLVDTV